MKFQTSIIPLVVFQILLVAPCYYLLLQQNKVVYVNSGKILNEYIGMKEARKVYQEKHVIWKANIDTLSYELKRSIAQYEEQNAQMTSKERDLSQELIRTKQKQLAEYQRAINEKATLEDEQLTRLVLEQVNSLIKEYGKKKGIKIILAVTDYGNIAYADEGLDVTDEILDLLNESYNGQ